MTIQHGTFEISDERARIDWTRVQAWLATSFWSPGISRERLERGAAASALVIGAWRGDEQAAFARVVSDTTRFAYLCDVWVDEGHRGAGLARAMVRFALTHPLLSEVDLWCLRTIEAHGVYAPLGFGPAAHPERWMERRRRDGNGTTLSC